MPIPTRSQSEPIRQSTKFGLVRTQDDMEMPLGSVGGVGVGVDSGPVLGKLPESGVELESQRRSTRVERSLITCKCKNEAIHTFLAKVCLFLMLLGL